MPYNIKPAYGTYSGNTITLTEVQVERANKKANLTTIPFPLSDSSQTDVFDYMGVTREVDIEGVHVATSIANLTGWLGSMMGLVQGAQTGSSLYVSTHIGSIIVKVWNFEYDWRGGNPLSVKWNMKLVESTAAS
ncbi:MAG: hypothetical protein ACE5FT_05540 [Candidatus Nanoarchaeia archaeon]